MDFTKFTTPQLQAIFDAVSKTKRDGVYHSYKDWPHGPTCVECKKLARLYRVINEEKERESAEADTKENREKRAAEKQLEEEMSTPPWSFKKIAYLSEEGVDPEDIPRLLQIPDDELDKNRARIDKLISDGRARFNLAVLRQVKKQSLRDKHPAIQPLLSLTRNKLNWDRPSSEQMTMPIAAAREELLQIIEKIQKNRDARAESQ